MTITHCKRMESVKFLFLLLHNFAVILNLKEHNRYLGQQRFSFFAGKVMSHAFPSFQRTGLTRVRWQNHSMFCLVCIVGQIMLFHLDCGTATEADKSAMGT